MTRCPKMNKLLKRLAGARPTDKVPIPAEMLPAVAYACACVGRWKAAQWLEHALLAGRDLIDGGREEFWDRLISRADPLLRLVALAADPRTGSKALRDLARSRVPAVATLGDLACQRLTGRRRSPRLPLTAPNSLPNTRRGSSCIGGLSAVVSHRTSA